MRGSIKLGNKPGDWFKKPSGNYEGQWNRKGLIPYGKANGDKVYALAETIACFLPSLKKNHYPEVSLSLIPTPIAQTIPALDDRNHCGS